MEDAPATEERKAPQRVACTFTGGLILQLIEEYKDEFGLPARRRCGPQVVVAGPTPGTGPAITDVDPDFFAAWLDQNRQSVLVTDGVIYPVDADGNQTDAPARPEK